MLESMIRVVPTFAGRPRVSLPLAASRAKRRAWRLADLCAALGLGPLAGLVGVARSLFGSEVCPQSVCAHIRLVRFCVEEEVDFSRTQQPTNTASHSRAAT